MNHNILPITNPPLNPATPISPRPCSTGHRIDIKLIVVILPTQQRPLEPIPALESLGRRDGHARFRQVRFQLIKDGGSPSGGYITCHAGYHPTDGISGFSDFVNAGEHEFRGGFIGASDNIGIHVRHGESVIVHVAPDILDFGHVRQHLDTVVQAQNLACDRSGRHTPNSLSGAGSSTPGHGAYPILGIIRGIGMTRPIRNLHIIVQIITGPLILVSD
mmetsp:Transcript_6294/g.7187  ORF Transcript_6294/g.7187 Transcript_6294/m.7187 type:complete len:218 (+) Transcript_6294:568-1221(+)